MHGQQNIQGVSFNAAPSMRHFYRTESVHPTVYSVRSAAPRTAIKESYSTCKQHHNVCSIHDMIYLSSIGPVIIIQGDQKVSVHLMITVQKHAKVVSITYHENVVRIGDNRWL
jgi:hypothetical protein